jgi:hypothetical protein
MLDSFPDIIRWPTGNRIQEVVQGFSNVLVRGARHIPDVIGAIDGTLIKIAAPRDNGPRYIDRKNHHSLNVLAVCDHIGRFTYLYAGEVGSVHDARVLRRSHLWKGIRANPARFFPGDTHLLGDAGYMMQNFLLTPYRHTEAGRDPTKRVFNKVHSSMRLTIEQAFGKWKNRWTILKSEIRMLSLERIVKTIIVTAILHNICSTQGDEWDEYFVQDPEAVNINYEDDQQPANERGIGRDREEQNSRLRGEQKRTRYANALFNLRN